MTDTDHKKRGPKEKRPKEKRPKKIGSISNREFLSAVAARKSTPGGGAVAAINAAQACALLAMVAEFTDAALSSAIISGTTDSVNELLDLADRDGAAFAAVMKAYRSGDNKEAALNTAALVPLQVLQICVGHIEDAEQLVNQGNPNLITDVGIAALLLSGCLRSCELNIRINTRSMQAPAPELAQALDAIPGQLDRLSGVIDDTFSTLQ